MKVELFNTQMDIEMCRISVLKKKFEMFRKRTGLRVNFCLKDSYNLLLSEWKMFVEKKNDAYLLPRVLSKKNSISLLMYSR